MVTSANNIQSTESKSALFVPFPFLKMLSWQAKRWVSMCNYPLMKASLMILILIICIHVNFFSVLFCMSCFFMPEYIFGHYLGFTISMILSRLNPAMKRGGRIFVLYMCVKLDSSKIMPLSVLFPQHETQHMKAHVSQMN